jgi:hypothetical protein
LSSTIIKTEIQPDVIDFVPENETYWQMALALLTYLPKYLIGWITKIRTIWFSSGTGTTFISTNAKYHQMTLRPALLTSTWPPELLG